MKLFWIILGLCCFWSSFVIGVEFRVDASIGMFDCLVVLVFVGFGMVFMNKAFVLDRLEVANASV